MPYLVGDVMYIVWKAVVVDVSRNRVLCLVGRCYIRRSMHTLCAVSGRQVLHQEKYAYTVSIRILHSTVRVHCEESVRHMSDR